MLGDHVLRLNLGERSYAITIGAGVLAVSYTHLTLPTM